MATTDEIYPLALQLTERETNLFPRITIYISSQEIGQSPVDLNHIGVGGYYNQFIPSTSGYYIFQTNVYTDSAHTTLSDDYGSAIEVTQVISSNLVYPSSAIIVHGDDNWITGSGGSGGSGGGGSDFISSQLNYISSNLEVYGYGGGKGGDTYIYPKKSPWTHKQRDEIIEDTKATKALIEEVDKKIKKFHEDETRLINKLSKTQVTKINMLLDIARKTKATANKLPDKEDISNVLREQSNIISVLMGYKEKLMKTPTIDDMDKLTDKLEHIMFKLLSPEDRDKKLKDVLKGNVDEKYDE